MAAIEFDQHVEVVTRAKTWGEHGTEERKFANVVPLRELLQEFFGNCNWKSSQWQPMAYPPADIVLPTIDGRENRRRRITELDVEQKSLLHQLGLSLPDRLQFLPKVVKTPP
jgi:hypothetical protein